MKSIKCPIRCGNCCKGSCYWNLLSPLRNLPVGFSCKNEGFGHYLVVVPVNSEKECIYLTKKGCKLKRKDRPEICLEYLCSSAEKALDGKNKSFFP